MADRARIEFTAPPILAIAGRAGSFWRGDRTFRVGVTIEHDADTISWRPLQRSTDDDGEQYFGYRVGIGDGATVTFRFTRDSRLGPITFATKALATGALQLDLATPDRVAVEGDPLEAAWKLTRGQIAVQAEDGHALFDDLPANTNIRLLADRLWPTRNFEDIRGFILSPTGLNVLGRLPDRLLEPPGFPDNRAARWRRGWLVVLTSPKAGTDAAPDEPGVLSTDHPVFGKYEDEYAFGSSKRLSWSLTSQAYDLSGEPPATATDWVHQVAALLQTERPFIGMDDNDEPRFGQGFVAGTLVEHSPDTTIVFSDRGAITMGNIERHIDWMALSPALTIVLGGKGIRQSTYQPGELIGRARIHAPWDPPGSGASGGTGERIKAGNSLWIPGLVSAENRPGHQPPSQSYRLDMPIAGGAAPEARIDEIKLYAVSIPALRTPGADRPAAAGAELRRTAWLALVDGWLEVPLESTAPKLSNTRLGTAAVKGAVDFWNLRSGMLSDPAEPASRRAGTQLDLLALTNTFVSLSFKTVDGVALLSLSLGRVAVRLTSAPLWWRPAVREENGEPPPTFPNLLIVGKGKELSAGAIEEALSTRLKRATFVSKELVDQSDESNPPVSQFGLTPAVAGSGALQLTVMKPSSSPDERPVRVHSPERTGLPLVWSLSRHDTVIGSGGLDRNRGLIAHEPDPGLTETVVLLREDAFASVKTDDLHVADDARRGRLFLGTLPYAEVPAEALGDDNPQFRYRHASATLDEVFHAHSEGDGADPSLIDVIDNTAFSFTGTFSGPVDVDGVLPAPQIAPAKLTVGRLDEKSPSLSLKFEGANPIELGPSAAGRNAQNGFYLRLSDNYTTVAEAYPGDDAIPDATSPHRLVRASGHPLAVEIEKSGGGLAVKYGDSLGTVRTRADHKVEDNANWGCSRTEFFPEQRDAEALELVRRSGTIVFGGGVVDGTLVLANTPEQPPERAGQRHRYHLHTGVSGPWTFAGPLDATGKRMTFPTLAGFPFVARSIRLAAVDDSEASSKDKWTAEIDGVIVTNADELPRSLAATGDLAGGVTVHARIENGNTVVTKISGKIDWRWPHAADEDAIQLRRLKASLELAGDELIIGSTCRVQVDTPAGPIVANATVSPPDGSDRASLDDGTLSLGLAARRDAGPGQLRSITAENVTIDADGVKCHGFQTEWAAPLTPAPTTGSDETRWISLKTVALRWATDTPAVWSMTLDGRSDELTATLALTPDGGGNLIGRAVRYARAPRDGSHEESPEKEFEDGSIAAVKFKAKNRDTGDPDDPHAPELSAGIIDCTVRLTEDGGDGADRSALLGRLYARAGGGTGRNGPTASWEVSGQLVLRNAIPFRNGGNALHHSVAFVFDRARLELPEWALFTIGQVRLVMGAVATHTITDHTGKVCARWTVPQAVRLFSRKALLKTLDEMGSGNRDQRLIDAITDIVVPGVEDPIIVEAGAVHLLSGDSDSSPSAAAGETYTAIRLGPAKAIRLADLAPLPTTGLHSVRLPFFAVVDAPDLPLGIFVEVDGAARTTSVLDRAVRPVLDETAGARDREALDDFRPVARSVHARHLASDAILLGLGEAAGAGEPLVWPFFENDGSWSYVPETMPDLSFATQSRIVERRAGLVVPALAGTQDLDLATIVTNAVAAGVADIPESETAARRQLLRFDRQRGDLVVFARWDPTRQDARPRPDGTSADRSSAGKWAREQLAAERSKLRALLVVDGHEAETLTPSTRLWQRRPRPPVTGVSTPEIGVADAGSEPLVDAHKKGVSSPLAIRFSPEIGTQLVFAAPTPLTPTPAKIASATYMRLRRFDASMPRQDDNGCSLKSEPYGARTNPLLASYPASFRPVSPQSDEGGLAEAASLPVLAVRETTPFAAPDELALWGSGAGVDAALAGAQTCHDAPLDDAASVAGIVSSVVDIVGFSARPGELGTVMASLVRGRDAPGDIADVGWFDGATLRRQRGQVGGSEALRVRANVAAKKDPASTPSDGTAGMSSQQQTDGLPDDKVPPRTRPVADRRALFAHFTLQQDMLDVGVRAPVPLGDDWRPEMIAVATNRDVRVFSPRDTGLWEADPIFLMREPAKEPATDSATEQKKFICAPFTCVLHAAGFAVPSEPKEGETEYLTVLFWLVSRKKPPSTIEGVYKWKENAKLTDKGGVRIPPPPRDGETAKSKWSRFEDPSGQRSNTFWQLTVDLWGDAGWLGDGSVGLPREALPDGEVGRLVLTRYTRKHIDDLNAVEDWKDPEVLIAAQFAAVDPKGIVMSPGLALTLMTASHAGDRGQRVEGYGRLTDENFSLYEPRGVMFTESGESTVTSIIWSRSADFQSVIPYDPRHHGLLPKWEAPNLAQLVLRRYHLNVCGPEGEIVPVARIDEPKCSVPE